MATARKVMHLHAYFNEKGQFSHYSLDTWKMELSLTKGAGYFVHLGEREIEFQVPSESDLERQALLALGDIEQKLRTDLHVKLMWAQIMKNALLRLENSDILDKVRPEDTGSEGPF